MRPDEANPTPARPAPTPQRANEATPNNQRSQQAAAEILRTQIDTLYTSPNDSSSLAATNEAPQAAAGQLEDVNPYDRTHSDNPQPQTDQWKQYHSAWQTYYQKYYEGYYAHHLQYAKQALQTQAATKPAGSFAQPPNELEVESTSDTLTKNEALYELRQKLLIKVQTSAKKARKSRHFIPIASALTVVLIFAFLQYNSILISNVMAYVTPGSIDPQNIVVDPTTNVNVGPDPLLIIPKINVDVPVHYDIGNDYASQMYAMKTGVAHFAIPGADSHPGQIGNTVIAGHSSNDLLDTGDYKFIFAQLDKMSVGDSVYANYHGTRYTYTITKKAVVDPTDVAALVYPTTKPMLTLLTCTPLGTALHRLLITAEQVSPDPSISTAAPAIAASAKTTSIPGTAPTLFERIFGG